MNLRSIEYSIQFFRNSESAFHGWILSPLTEVEEETRNPANLQIPSNWMKSTSRSFHGVFLSLLAIDCVVTGWQMKLALSRKTVSRALLRALQVKKEKMDKSDRFVRRTAFSIWRHGAGVSKACAFHPWLLCSSTSLSLSLSLFCFVLRSIHTRDQPEGFVYTWESKPQRRALPRYSCLLPRFLLVITR